MDTDYDVCIIGSGAGAGPVAYSLAKQGKKVVILEKGPWITEKNLFKDEIAVCRRNTFIPSLRDEPQEIEDIDEEGNWVGESNYDTDWNFWNGSMMGGSSNLMSGFFHRLKPMDFRLLSEFGKIEGANVTDWPISYEDMEPYFSLTEKMVGISGKVVNHPYLEPRSTPDFPYPPLQENPLTKLIDKASKNLGYHSIPLPRAILSQPKDKREPCSYSGYCGSYGCNTGAKGSSRAALLNLAFETGNCKFRPHAHVFKLDSNRKGLIEGVRYYNAIGTEIRLNAKVYVVACQAVETARLLLFSTGPKFPNGLANNNLMVGKNLLFSAGGIGSCLFYRDQFPTDDFEAYRDFHFFVNRALQDWYVIDDAAFGHRMKGGTIDFLLAHANPISKAQKIKWKGDKLLWGSALKKRLKDEFTNKVKLNFEIFCDWLPNDNCFVSLSKKVRDKYGLPVAKIRVGYHPHDLIPGKYLAKKTELLVKTMGGKNIQSHISGSPPTNLIAGSCRFGTDPATSILDKYCRAHEVENLFVTDGSFMPTGGSVPYTWTIYANAFRVADEIAKHC